MIRRVVLLLAFTAIAHAQPPGTLTYRVKAKDTLDVIAAEYYGDRDKAMLIVIENKLKDRRVKGGERLHIPVTREIATEKGDTFESLAQTYLGDPKRGPVLADFNEHDVTDIPATGTLLTIPAQITHVAQNDETLGHVSSTYFGDPKHAELLRRYNFLDKSSLEKGDSVLVPLLNIRVRPGKLPPLDGEARERRDEHKRIQAEAEAALPLARTSWMQGEFAGVKGTLSPFASKLDFLDTQVAVEIGLLLGRAHVAFGETDRAVKSFAMVRERKPVQTLSAYAESPKVIEAWKQAGGQVRD